MLHYTFRCVRGRLMFRRWSHAALLWRRLTIAIPGIVAVVFMPNHGHLLHRRNILRPLGRLVRGYARTYNRLLGGGGRLFRDLADPDPVRDWSKERNVERYIHLNPCRKPYLVDDPLGWAFSTHRDACGLVVAPVRRQVVDPHGYHHRISNDGTVRIGGTELPVSRNEVCDPNDILDAVSSVTRTPFAELRKRGPGRLLLIRALRSLTEMTVPQIARFVGVDRRTVQRTKPEPGDAAVRLVEQVCGDPRFAGLHDGDLLHTAVFRPYRERGLY